jgi:hypothetical protein
MPLRKTIAVIVRVPLVDWASPQKASNPLCDFVWLLVEHKVAGIEMWASAPADRVSATRTGSY